MTSPSNLEQVLMSASQALHRLTRGYFSNLTHYCLCAHSINMIFSCWHEYITLIPSSEISNYCSFNLKYFSFYNILGMCSNAAFYQRPRETFPNDLIKSNYSLRPHILVFYFSFYHLYATVLYILPFIYQCLLIQLKISKGQQFYPDNHVWFLSA